MSIVTIPTRSQADANSSADINTLMRNITNIYASLGGDIDAKYKDRSITVVMPSMSVADNIVMIRIPFAMTLSKVRAGAKVAPTVSVIKPKLMYHATDPDSVATIFASETNAPSIAVGDHTDDSGSPTTTSLAAGGWMGIGFSAIDTGLGAGIVVELIGTPT
jgi:hypothetical protein